MKEKLTKEELLEQLAEIEKQEENRFLKWKKQKKLNK